jgi:hypothetical protein
VGDCTWPKSIFSTKPQIREEMCLRSPASLRLTVWIMLQAVSVVYTACVSTVLPLIHSTTLNPQYYP